MPPVPRCLPPREIREKLENHGYSIIDHDSDNWTLEHPDKEDCLIIPHAIDLVPVSVAWDVSEAIGMNNYLA